MGWQDLIRDIPVARARLGAHQSFLLLEQDYFYIVEDGYVDLFAVLLDERRRVLARGLFVTRFLAGKAFFGTPIPPEPSAEQDGIMAFQAVPSRDTALIRGKREDFASLENFDLEAVSLIDDWVSAAAEFVARHESPIPREVQLLEADPDIPYETRAVVSAHHLEVLWVETSRPAHFVGRPEFPVEPETILPLNEHTWLTLPEEMNVSAVHTPGIIITGRLWAALDLHALRILRCAALYRKEAQEEQRVRRALSRGHRGRLRGMMVQDLSGLLGGAPAHGEAAHGGRNALHSAATVVAESVGVQLDDSLVTPGEGDPLEVVGAMVAPAGIRTRQIGLSPGWEQQDGPSFLGITRGDEPRPVAVVNRGRGHYEVTDPASGKVSPVNREWVESLDTHGTMFYPPFARGVDSGLAALLQVLRGRGRDILGVALMGALAAIVALLIPILTGKLLGEIIPRVDISMWIAALVALVLGAFATAAVSLVGALCMLRIEARIDETLQSAVWNRLLSLPMPFFRRYLAGDLADRANGVTAIRQMLTGATSASILSGVFSIFSYGLLFYYSWELALWAGVAVLLLASGSWFFATRQIRHQRAVFEAQGAVDGLVFQIILGLAKLRQAHAEIHALKRWSELYVEQKRESLSARKWVAGQLTFNALFVPLAQLAMLALIWYSLIEGYNPAPDEDSTPFSLADFLSFNAAFGQFLMGVTGLTATWATVIAVLPLFERVQPIIEAQPESIRGGVALPGLSGRIEFENVTFRYPTATSDTLRSVSFHIRPGEYVAFVGPSGAGKSTLYRLLLGFERPSAGTVLIDGYDLLSLDLSSMRSQMGVVLQNGQVVPDSIFRNIASESSLTVSDAWEAARAAGLEDDIRALPIGMQTVLSEGGAGLSGGQKQRLLVARALARKPRLLLFDEATSMLDNRTQAIIRNTLRDMTATRVLIAHRLSTVMDVDRIYVMQDGRIVESGSYSNLMQRGGVLADLARRQII